MSFVETDDASAHAQVRFVQVKALRKQERRAHVRLMRPLGGTQRGAMEGLPQLLVVHAVRVAQLLVHVIVALGIVVDPHAHRRPLARVLDRRNNVGQSLAVRSVDIIIPAYNEGACLRALVERLVHVITPLPYRTRILIVDDGSTDDSEIVLAALSAQEPRLGVVHLSRNFGHQAALTAGLDLADADAVIMLDADLQKPPELIPEFLAAWERGADVVHGVRRASDARGASAVGPFKRFTSRWFYRLMNKLSDVPLINDAPDFRLLDAKVVRAARNLREQDRLLRGLVAWAGFKQVSVPYDEEPRAFGHSKYSTMRMVALGLAGILSFSRVPLRVATIAGFIVSLLAFGYGAYVGVMHLFYERPVHGWTSLAILISVLAGAQMMFLGMIGEYLGQVLMETKARPLYLISAMKVPPLHALDQRLPSVPTAAPNNA